MTDPIIKIEHVSYTYAEAKVPALLRMLRSGIFSFLHSAVPT